MTYPAWLLTCLNPRIRHEFGQHCDGCAACRESAGPGGLCVIGQLARPHLVERSALGTAEARPWMGKAIRIIHPDEREGAPPLTWLSGRPRRSMRGMVAWARIKQVAVVTGLVLLGALAVVVAVLLGRRLLGRRDTGKPDDGSLVDALGAVADRVREANAVAAVEVAQARAKDESVQHQLTAVMADPDGARRRRALVELRKRLESEAQ